MKNNLNNKMFYYILLFILEKKERSKSAKVVKDPFLPDYVLFITLN